MLFLDLMKAVWSGMHGFWIDMEDGFHKNEPFFCIIPHVFNVRKIANKSSFITEIWQKFSNVECNIFN
jgi:hypothetical protein